MDNEPIKNTIISEIKHNYYGTLQFFREIAATFMIILNMIRKKQPITLTESLQLRRSVDDLTKFIPFATLIIIPFAEILIPALLMLNLDVLPSTYLKHKEKIQRINKISKIQLSSSTRFTKFIDQMKDKGHSHEMEEFITLSEAPTTELREELLLNNSYFRDEFTLENLDSQLLRELGLFFNHGRYTSEDHLRHLISMNCNQIKEADLLLFGDDVNSLSNIDLYRECVKRGIRISPTSPHIREDMISNLRRWGELSSYKHKIPVITLICFNMLELGRNPVATTTDDIKKIIGYVDGHGDTTSLDSNKK